MPPNVVKHLRPHGRQWVWAAAAALLTANGLKYRKRLESLPVLKASDGAPASDDLGRFVLVTAPGVTVDAGAAAVAAAYADREGLDCVDLVPPDLDVERAIEFIRMVDPETFRRDRLAVGRTAASAVLIDRDLLDRIDVKLPETVEEADLAELVVDAKHFAPLGVDLAVLYGLHAAVPTPGRTRDLLFYVNGDKNAPGSVLTGLGLLAAGLAASPAWGVAALAAYAVQPALVAGDSPLGASLGARGTAGRPLRNAARAVGLLRNSQPTRREEETQAKLDQAATQYRQVLAAGTERFFLPPRTTCPWCGGPELERRADSIDYAQSKPGRFHVDRCRTCSHTFSNPPMSPEGFEFYYQDFYSGLFEHALTKKFQVDEPLYTLRADIVRRNYDAGEPKLWLDVGTGHGHFPLSAQPTFPETRFEALDMGEAVLTAARRGWVAQSHYGLLPELSASLAGRYDVVSMHHCLEHTPDPRDQLTHLKTVLRPGGYLSIENPDPECYAGDLLKQLWGPFFQPQHQNMVPIGNLCAALRAEGFTIVATEREEAHEQFEATMAGFLWLNGIAPPPGLPWRAQKATDSAKRVAAFTLGAPLLAAGVVVDKLADGFIRKMPNGPNAYRVLARRNDDGGPGPGGGERERITAGRVPDAGPEGHPGTPGLASVAGDTVTPTRAPAPIASAPAEVVAPAPVALTAPVASPVAPAAVTPAEVAPAPVTPATPAPAPAGPGVASLAGAPAWSTALLSGLTAEAGAPLAFAAVPKDLAPEPLPETFGFELASADGSAAPDGWAERLLVRVSGDRDNLEREAAAIGIATGHGSLAPTVRAILPLAAAGPEAWALVTDRPTGAGLLELIGPHLNYFDAVLAGFAEHHATLHNRTEGAAPTGPLPGVDAATEVARLDAARYPAQVAWLQERLAGPGAPVLCHAGYEPRVVTGPGPDTWDRFGGPGHGLTVSNWRNAVVAEREFDVGLTLMAFWVAPMYVEHRALRAQFKMIRNKLASRYLRSYADHGPLDAGRVAFWQAFHAQRLVAQVNGAYDDTGSPFLPVEVALLPKGVEKELSRLFRIVSARERRGEWQEAG